MIYNNIKKNTGVLRIALASFTFLFAFCLFSVKTANAATLYFSPSSGDFTVGNILTAGVMVNTQGKAVNNADVVINFPSDLLEVVSLSKSGSIFTLWVEEPAFSNNTGVITFNGGLPTPGFTGSAGRLLNVTFRVRKPGSASLLFPSAAVRANDGYGTDILQTRAQATYNLSAIPKALTPTPTPTPTPAPQNQPVSDLLAHITSSTHPDQTKWYSLSRAVLDWTNAQGVSAVRLGYDQDASGVPTVVYTDPISHKELQLGDGIWYFHVQEKGTSGWGPIATFRIQVDTTPPSPVVLVFPNGATTATSTIAVEFATTDALSGIDHYQLAVDGSSFEVSSQDGSGVYALSSGDTGTHTLAVTAYDKAGNTVNAEQQFASLGVKVSPPPASPTWSAYVWTIANYLALFLLLLAIIAIIVFIGWYLWHRLHTFRRRVVNKEERMHILVHRQFNELKNAIADEITALEDIRSRRELTLEEERLINRLQKLIDQSEHVLDKEIHQMLNK